MLFIISFTKESIVMIAYIKNKKVLFITTKRLDYIRNTQEIRLLNVAAGIADDRVGACQCAAVQPVQKFSEQPFWPDDLSIFCASFLKKYHINAGVTILFLLLCYL